MKTTLIRGGTVVVEGSVRQQDLLIRGEKIAALGELSDVIADRVFDAGNLLVLPGGVDTHVHFNDVFMSTVSVHDYYTGSLSAAFGGTTTLLDFSNQAKGATLMSTLDAKHAEADGLALVDWGVHPVITQPTDETLAEIPLVVNAGSPTIKCYMTYREEGLLIEQPDLKRILVVLRAAGGMLMVHAEDNDLAESGVANLLNNGFTDKIYHTESKPQVVETKAIADGIQMVRAVGGKLFIVHLASLEGMQMVNAARAEGLDVLAETCMHYLTFTDQMLHQDDGLKWICSPPLRDQDTQDQLWQGIKDGRLVQVTSDDAAYSWEATQYGNQRFDLCPNGMPGVEPRFTMLYSKGVAEGRISLPRFVELIATNPARIFGMYPQKGTLLPGTDADIVLFDPAAKWSMGQAHSHSSNDWHAYEGIEVNGKVEKVFSRGELIIDGAECLAKKGRGQYLHRKLNQ
ncbi:MAG: dihydropyrimidinase [Chloroflexi bacterium]|nr:dihydropyrimidinase [Chloroflexota bacterium]